MNQPGKRLLVVLLTVLASCSTLKPAGLSPGLHTGEISQGEIDRPYFYYVPENRRERPGLILVLHGWTEDAEQIRSFVGTGIEALADREGLIVCYPSGYGFSWNDNIRGKQHSAKVKGVDDVGFLSTLIDTLAAKVGINPAQVFVFGFSNGGAMALRLAQEIPDKLTAVAAFSSNLPDDTNMDAQPVDRPLAVMLAVGTGDPWVPIEGGPMRVRGEDYGAMRSSLASAQWFATRNGMTEPGLTVRLPHLDSTDPTSVDRTDWSEPGKAPVVLYVVHGGAHNVPQPQSGFPAETGPMTRDLDAAEAFWQFCQAAMASR